MRNYIDKAIRYLLVFIMGILVITVIWQVFTRYVLQSPSTFTDELSRFLLIWVSLLGAAYASGNNRHLAIDILPSKLNQINQRKLKVLINALIVLFAVSVMVAGGTFLAYVTANQLSPSLGLSMGYVYSVVPLSGLLVCYYKAYDLTMLLQPSPHKD